MKKLMITSLFLVALFAMTGCSEDNNPMAVDTNEKVKPSERTTIVDLAVALCTGQIKAGAERPPT